MSPEYLAGLFDGEGCIDTQTMYPSTHRQRFYCRPRVRIALTWSCRHLLEEVQAHYGGYLGARRKGSGKQNDSLSWELLNESGMRAFVGTVGQHLILKRNQAELCIWFFDHLKGRCSRGSAPDMERARKQFAEELKAMKQDLSIGLDESVSRIHPLMRQSDLRGNTKRVGEIATPPA